MDQEKIGEFIREIRQKNKMSQEKFGEKYGVTYQAVSKWENGKNLPDISILKEICKEYNKDINELLTDNKISAKSKKVSLIIILILIFTLGIGVYFIAIKDDGGFQFKTLKTTCDDFELSGSIAYSKNKTSIYISDITYCGKDNQTKYKKIDCAFYEVDGDTKKAIDSYSSKEKMITLEEFLKKVKFNVDHYSTTCKMYKENALVLEIKALDENDQTTFYNIPLELEDNCK